MRDFRIAAPSNDTLATVIVDRVETFDLATVTVQFMLSEPNSPTAVDQLLARIKNRCQEIIDLGSLKKARRSKNG